MQYTIKGKTYTLVSKTSAASAGSKWFGKFVFILKDTEGNEYRYLGKQITSNSKLYPS